MNTEQELIIEALLINDHDYRGWKGALDSRDGAIILRKQKLSQVYQDDGRSIMKRFAAIKEAIDSIEDQRAQEICRAHIYFYPA